MRQAQSFLLALAHAIATINIICVSAISGSQIPLPHSPPLNQNRNVSWQFFTELEGLARLVDTTYCINPSNIGISHPFNCLSRCNTFDTLELVTTWHTGLLLTDSAGFIAIDHAPSDKRIVIAFRGTLSLANVIVDLATVPQAYVPYIPVSGGGGGGDGSGGGNDTQPLAHAAPISSTPAQEQECRSCTVHMGFLRSWQDAQAQIIPHVAALRAVHPNHRLELIGHSLGGAVALLAGLDMHARGWEPTITTFGQPRVGNAAFAAWVDWNFNLVADAKRGESLPGAESDGSRLVLRRVTHVDDPVPLLPLAEWGYAPHAGEVFVQKPDLPPDVWDLQLCMGDEDSFCSAGRGSVLFNPLSGLSAHRNYFWTLGLCVPDSWRGLGEWKTNIGSQERSL